jgi:hypothetical protein
MPESPAINARQHRKEVAVAALPEDTTAPAGNTAHDPVGERASTPRRLHAVDPTESAPGLVEIEDVQDHPDSTTDSTIVRGVAWLREAFTPDSGLYTDRQPSIAETMRRAKAGRQLADTGPLRVLGTAHGYVAAANKAVVRTWEWVVDHPARLAVFTALMVLAVAFPPTRQLLAWLLAPITWVQQALD